MVLRANGKLPPRGVTQWGIKIRAVPLGHGARSSEFGDHRRSARAGRLRSGRGDHGQCLWPWTHILQQAGRRADASFCRRRIGRPRPKPVCGESYVPPRRTLPRAEPDDADAHAPIHSATNGFSNKVENHVHAVALHTMFYSFVEFRRRCGLLQQWRAISLTSRGAWQTSCASLMNRKKNAR